MGFSPNTVYLSCEGTGKSAGPYQIGRARCRDKHSCLS